VQSVEINLMFSINLSSRYMSTVFHQRYHNIVKPTQISPVFVLLQFFQCDVFGLFPRLK